MRKASRKSFSPELLQQLREMSVTAALDAMEAKFFMWIGLIP